jgi:hypothetical protein
MATQIVAAGKELSGESGNFGDIGRNLKSVRA